MDFSAMPDTGFIVPGICACWLYEPKSGSSAILEWVISNPKSTQRDQGLDSMLGMVNLYARAAGYRNIFTATKHSKLVSRLQLTHNYLIGDENVTHLMKIL